MSEHVEWLSLSGRYVPFVEIAEAGDRHGDGVVGQAIPDDAIDESKLGLIIGDPGAYTVIEGTREELVRFWSRIGHALEVGSHTVEIVHHRDPDMSCEHTIFVDGEQQHAAEIVVADVDPGAGHTRADWDETTEVEYAALSPAAGTFVRDLRNTIAETSSHITR